MLVCNRQTKGSSYVSLTANLSLKSGTRSEFLHGREYLVAHATLIVPGVLNGSQGALLYTSKDVNSNPEVWNGIPAVLNHPVDSDTGLALSGRNPRVLNEYGLGWVFNAYADGKLRSEVWFDVENTKRISPQTLAKLKRGEPVELSTGLYTRNQPKQGWFKGVPYSGIARNYRPDHLAILDTQQGACSNGDGCGVLVNSGDVDDWDIEAVENVDEHEGRWVTMGGTHVFIGKGGEIIHGPAALKDKNATSKRAENSFGKYGNPRSKNSGKFKKHGAGTGTGDVHRAGQRGSVIVTERDRELGAEAAQLADEGAHPSWVGDNENLWLRAVRESCETDNSPPEYGLAVRIYKNLGGNLAEQVTSNSQSLGVVLKHTNNQLLGDLTVVLNSKQRERVIQDLTKNCECWGDDEGAEVLNEMSDERLLSLHKQLVKGKKDAVVANAARKGIALKDGSQLRFSDEGKHQIVANEGETCPECGEDMEDCTCDDEEESPSDDEEYSSNTTRNKRTVTRKVVAVNNQRQQQRKPQSAKEWLEAAPDSIREVVHNAMEIQTGQKEKLVARLTSNITDKERKETVTTNLMKKRFGDLKEMVELLPAPVVANRKRSNESSDISGFFFGGDSDDGQQPTDNSGEYDDQDEDISMMTPPTINFAEELKEDKARRKVKAG